MLVLLLVLLVGAVTFLLGVTCGHYRLFPFSLLVALKERLVPPPRRDSSGSAPEPGCPITITTPDDLRQARERLANYVWGTPSPPHDLLPDEIRACDLDTAYRRFARVADLEWWVVRMPFGVDSKLLSLSPREGTSGTAVIYHQGHEGDVSHGAATILKLLRAGFQVVALAMPLLGPNSRPVVPTRRHGPLVLSDHDMLGLVDHEYGFHSIRFFVEPVIAAVNELTRRGFDSFAMVGPSGGGWTTTLAAALDVRITRSFPVAGSLPFALRGRGEMSDYEQQVPQLYEIANYAELHVLGASGSRYQLQVLNRFDPVSFGGDRGKRYEAAVQEALEGVGGGRFQVLIDDSWSGHGISKSALERIVLEIGR